MHHAPEVDVHRAPEDVERQRLDRARGRDAGVAHQEMHRAVRGEHRVARLVDRGGARDVAAVRRRVREPRRRGVRKGPQAARVGLDSQAFF